MLPSIFNLIKEWDMMYVAKVPIHGILTFQQPNFYRQLFKHFMYIIYKNILSSIDVLMLRLTFSCKSYRKNTNNNSDDTI